MGPQKLIDLLAEYGINQKKLASMCRVKPPAVTQWKDTKIPSGKYMKISAICNRYGIVVDDSWFNWEN